MTAANTKRLGGLWVLFAIQILAAIWLWWPHQRGPVTGQPWLTFSPKAVTKVALTDGSGGKDHMLTLKKHDGKWRLPNAEDFPADTAKVKSLLHGLAGLKGTLPVAVTEDAAKRFHVAKNKFETKVTLKAGQKQLAQVYVGNAAGANLVYLRRADDHVIEANTLPTRLVSASASDWRDQHLLYLAQSDIRKLALPHLTLVKQKAGWKAKGGKVKLDQSKVKKLVGKLAQLDFVKVLGKKAAHPSSAGFKVLLDEKGRQLTYDFAAVQPKLDKSDKTDKSGKSNKSNQQDTPPKVTWHMTRSDLPYIFTVSSDLAKKLEIENVQSVAKAKVNAKGKNKNKNEAKAPAKNVSASSL